MNRYSPKKDEVSEAVFLGVSEPPGPFYFWRKQEMPYEEFSFWDRYEYKPNHFSQRETCCHVFVFGRCMMTGTVEIKIQQVLF